jgi:hypothetical protein
MELQGLGLQTTVDRDRRETARRVLVKRKIIWDPMRDGYVGSKLRWKGSSQLE